MCSLSNEKLQCVPISNYEYNTFYHYMKFKGVYPKWIFV